MSTALVFGGAFNPPTIAHIELADFVRKQCGFDAVIFVPSKMSYIKNDQQKDFAFKDSVRYEMLCKIAASRPWMKVSDYELTLPEQPRTYRTLCHLRDEGYQCKLLFGSDKLPELQTVWRHMEEICREFRIVCMKRSGDNCEQVIDGDPYLQTLKTYIQIIETPDTYQLVSSTKVRQLFKEKNYDKILQIVPSELNGLKDYADENMLL